MVLEVLRILKEEVELRERTRSSERAKDAMETTERLAEVAALGGKQSELEGRVKALLDQLSFLETDQGKNFGKDKARLGRARSAMADAVTFLGRSSTGADTIAAETEAIEALLETKRMGQGNGGGGGSNPGGANPKAGMDLLASALAGLGEGHQAEVRAVEQTSGTVRSWIPEEYRRGLDAYFGALEDE